MFRIKRFKIRFKTRSLWRECLKWTAHSVAQSASLQSEEYTLRVRVWNIIKNVRNVCSKRYKKRSKCFSPTILIKNVSIVKGFKYNQVEESEGNGIMSQLLQNKTLQDIDNIFQKRLCEIVSRLFKEISWTRMMSTR